MLQITKGVFTSTLSGVYQTVYIALENGIVPVVWKCSTTCPIAKYNTASDLSKYRPIAITCVAMNFFTNYVTSFIMFNERYVGSVTVCTQT